MKSLILAALLIPAIVLAQPAPTPPSTQATLPVPTVEDRLQAAMTLYNKASQDRETLMQDRASLVAQILADQREITAVKAELDAAQKQRPADDQGAAKKMAVPSSPNSKTP